MNLTAARNRCAPTNKDGKSAYYGQALTIDRRIMDDDRSLMFGECIMMIKWFPEIAVVGEQALKGSKTWRSSCSV